jgi:hypothetical protein
MSGSIPEKSATVPTNNSPSIIYTKRQSNRETKTNKREREDWAIRFRISTTQIDRHFPGKIPRNQTRIVDGNCTHPSTSTSRQKKKRKNVSYFVCPLRNNKSQVWLTHKDGRAVVWWIVRTDALAVDLLLQDVFTFLFCASQMKEKKRKKKIEIRWKRTI